MMVHAACHDVAIAVLPTRCVKGNECSRRESPVAALGRRPTAVDLVQILKEDQASRREATRAMLNHRVQAEEEFKRLYHKWRRQALRDVRGAMYDVRGAANEQPTAVGTVTKSNPAIVIPARESHRLTASIYCWCALHCYSRTTPTSHSWRRTPSSSPSLRLFR